MGMVLKISKYNIKFKIPDWLNNLIVSPVLLYRRWRYGYEFRLIRMSQPRYAKVDPADYERLRKYEWFAVEACKKFYARRFIPDAKTRKRRFIYMHREIIEVRREMVVDHVNQDGMDNRGANLREAMPWQNICNRKKYSGKYTSKYIGVSRSKGKRKWEAQVGFNKKTIRLGCFDNEIEAAKARDRAARKYHGEFACLNFPEE
jgi:hypothetical protein